MQWIFVCRLCILQLYWNCLLVLTGECWKLQFLCLVDLTLLCLSQHNFNFYVCFLPLTDFPREGTVFLFLILSVEHKFSNDNCCYMKITEPKNSLYLFFKLWIRKTDFYNSTSNFLGAVNIWSVALGRCFQGQTVISYWGG